MIPSPQDSLAEIIETLLQKIRIPLFTLEESFVEETIITLNAPETFESLDRDPYWPKWESPWWKMLLLYEIGASHKIPTPILQKMEERLENHYLSFFPLIEAELPLGKTDRHILCHCALASLLKIFHAAHRPLQERFSWIRPWFHRYLLPDGGFNCDEAVYSRPTPKSSIVSTVPMLEAMIETFPQKTLEEQTLLQQGISYLLKRHLFRSLAKNFQVIDPLWVTPGFPRFYEYDLLRGLTCVIQWAIQENQMLPSEAILDAIQQLAPQLNEQGHLISNRIARGKEKTKRLQPSGDWTYGHTVGTFSLLEQIKTRGASFYLTQEFWNVLTNLKTFLNENKLK